ncbi:Fic family protein [Isosphaeraceae bacterium EP7]
MWIHEHPDWPHFIWDAASITDRLASLRHRQGRLVGRMEGLGFRLRGEAELATLTENVLRSSEIEGDILEPEQVRSSIARRLGIDIGGLLPADRRVEGVVEMMLDAAQNSQAPLSAERLYNWHAALFPTGRSGLGRIVVGSWRDDANGPMQVVSGPIGKERVHFQAPEAGRLEAEMTHFLDNFNAETAIDPVIKAAIAHLWFVTIHPFDDGNGRIARAIADLALARSDRSPQRFYSMSAQIQLERKAYYEILEQTQNGPLDITLWLDWFLACLDRSLVGAEQTLTAVLTKARFWEAHSEQPFNDRQRKIINLLLDGFDGKLTSSKWAKLGKCSQDTAHRDIVDLMGRHILAQEGVGRGTAYSLVETDSM